MRVPKPRPSPFRVAECPAGSASRFVTIGPDHPVWANPDAGFGCVRVSRAEVNESSFVRVRPPPDVPDDVLQAVLASLRAVARRVTGGTRPRGAVLPSSAGTSPRGDVQPRDVVNQLVAEARTRDRGALSMLCAAVMEEAKL